MRKLIPSVVPASRVALATAASLALASAASAQTDYSVTAIEVNQAIQSGSTPLTAGRSTFVRASLGVTGPNLRVDGIMRVFVNGLESPDSPIFSTNGPRVPIAGAPLGQINGTLNFVFVPPASNDVVLEVEVNPTGPNFVFESNLSNNKLSTAQLDFQVRDTPELAYAPIDNIYSGSPNPNAPDPTLIEPGVGDNFLQAIYPGADWFYHRIDAPTKLWTAANLASSSSAGSALNSALDMDRLLMVPIPDYIYGWAPGGLPGYNGVSTIGGTASMGNTETFRHQRTFAHEVGHNFGLFHNSVTTNVPGIDVEHHLAITEMLPQLKVAGLNDIMVPGLFTPQAWIGPNNYNFFFNHAAFNPALDGSNLTSSPMLIVSGLWNKDQGTFDIRDIVRVEAGGELSTPVPVSEANLIVKSYSNGVLMTKLPLGIYSSIEEGGCAGESSAPIGDRIVSLTASLPAAGGIDQLELIDLGHPGSTWIGRTASAPEVAFTSMEDGIVSDGRMTISWQGSDADGDEVKYYLRFSRDGVRMSPLLTGTTATSYEADLHALPGFIEGQSFFELLASDGLNTTRVRTAHLASSLGFEGVVGNDPWVEIMTPDDGKRYKFGQTVVLHSSGWDIEDRALGGGDIQWSSSVDGPLGSGRRVPISTLTAGVHTISVTATDSDGNQTTDTANVVITPRGLPVTSTCQAVLGFGGPGTGTLTMCGDDFGTGMFANVQVANAVPNTSGFLVGSFTSNPIPFFGGTLVPNPATISIAVGTNAAGGFLLPGVEGGGGPATLYLQYIYVDPSQTEMLGFTNAIELDVLP